MDGNKNACRPEDRKTWKRVEEQLRSIEVEADVITKWRDWNRIKKGGITNKESGVEKNKGGTIHDNKMDRLKIEQKMWLTKNKVELRSIEVELEIIKKWRD